jgi:hypothetical protein
MLTEIRTVADVALSLRLMGSQFENSCSKVIDSDEKTLHQAVMQPEDLGLGQQFCSEVENSTSVVR